MIQVLIFKAFYLHCDCWWGKIVLVNCAVTSWSSLTYKLKYGFTKVKLFINIISRTPCGYVYVIFLTVPATVPTTSLYRDDYMGAINIKFQSQEASFCSFLFGFALTMYKRLLYLMFLIFCTSNTQFSWAVARRKQYDTNTRRHLKLERRYGAQQKTSRPWPTIAKQKHSPSWAHL